MHVFQSYILIHLVYCQVARLVVNNIQYHYKIHASDFRSCMNDTVVHNHVSTEYLLPSCYKLHLIIASSVHICTHNAGTQYSVLVCCMFDFVHCSYPTALVNRVAVEHNLVILQKQLSQQIKFNCEI